VAVEKLFQLSDVARPDFPHDLFVFHVVSLRNSILRGGKKVTKSPGSPIV
jgi:hypothetical protein